MNRSLLVIIILWLMSSALCSYGQDFPLLHYSIEDGLPGNNVYDIYRDSKGYLWISTDKGVARYNGIKFEIFTTNDGLPDNEVFFTREDNYGRLWLASYNGKLCYYKDGIFHTELNEPFLRLPFKTSFTKYILPEADSSVTICFQEQYKYVNISRDKLQIIDPSYPKNIINNNYQLFIKKDNDGFEIHFGFVTFHTGPDGAINKTMPAINPVISNSIYCQDKVYFSNDSFIYQEDGNKIAEIGRYKFNKYTLQRAYFEGGNRYYATAKGLIVNDTMLVLKGNNISSVTQDNSGNYWIGTLNDGIFSKCFFNVSLFDSAYSGKVKYSTVIGNRVFFATDNLDLYSFDKNAGSVSLFKYRDYSHKKNDPKIESHYLLDTNLKFYVFYGNENIVIDNVISSKRKVSHFMNANTDNIKSVFFINTGIYLQCIRGFMAVDYPALKEGEDINKYAQKISNPADPNRIFGAARYGNSIWYSSVANIYKIDDHAAQLQPGFKNIALKYFSFFGDDLIGYTHDNQLLICSDINGDIKIDTVHFQNCIWNKLYRLNDSSILASTNDLYRILTIRTTAKGTKISASVVENLYLPLHAESICIDSSNCYFFKNGTVTSIEIKNLFLKPAPPALFFRSLKTKRNVLFANTEAMISYDEARNINLSYSAVSFGAKKIYYQYSFSKNETDSWRDIEGEEININHPGYGTFTIKVRAKTLSGEYGTPIVFTLIVSEPYWAKWWFISLIILLALMTIGLAIRYRIKAILRKKQKTHDNEIKYLKAEFKSLNALMNPHFIFNTLNNVQSLFNGNEKQAANEYLRIFSDLVRQNMHNISKDLISLQKEIDLVNNYLMLERLRFEDRLSYTINIGPDLDLSEIMIPPLLIQPLVENSLKHGILPKGDEGKIIINIFDADNIVYIEVKDNGIGMTRAKLNSRPQHESFGIKNIKQRIAQLSLIQNKKIGFEITDTSNSEGTPLWTIVTISIPA